MKKVIVFLLMTGFSFDSFLIASQTPPPQDPAKKSRLSQAASALRSAGTATRGVAQAALQKARSKIQSVTESAASAIKSVPGKVRNLPTSVRQTFQRAPAPAPIQPTDEEIHDRRTKAGLIIKGIGAGVAAGGSAWYLTGSFAKWMLLNIFLSEADIDYFKQFYAAYCAATTGVNVSYVQAAWDQLFLSNEGMSILMKEFPINTLMSKIAGTIPACLLGIGVFLILFKLIEEYFDKNALAAVAEKAKDIIDTHLAASSYINLRGGVISEPESVKWNPRGAWEEITKYTPKKAAGKLGHAVPIQKELGQLVLLQFIPILSCALYENKSLGIESDVDLAKKVVNFINYAIARAGDPKLKDAWIASQYAMLYYNSNFNANLQEEVVLTAAQAAFLTGDEDLITSLFSNLEYGVIRQLLFANRDIYGRTVMHVVARQKTSEILNLFEKFLAIASLRLPIERIGALNLTETESEEFKRAIPELLIPYFDPKWYRRKIMGQKPLLLDNQGQSPLHTAAFNLNVDFIKKFFNDPALRTVAMLQQDVYGRTPLHLAVIASTSLKQSDEEKAQNKYTPESNENAVGTVLLLIKGLDPKLLLKILTLQDRLGKTPLHYAAEEKNLEILMLLLAGTSPEIKKKSAQVVKGYLQKIKEVMGKLFGSNLKFSDVLKITDNDGNTPIHSAVQSFGKSLKKYTLDSIENSIGSTLDQLLLKIDITVPQVQADWKYEFERNQIIENQLKTVMSYINGIRQNLEKDEEEAQAGSSDKSMLGKLVNKAKSLLSSPFVILAGKIRTLYGVNLKYDPVTYLSGNLKKDIVNLTRPVEPKADASDVDKRAYLNDLRNYSVYEVVSKIRNEESGISLLSKIEPEKKGQGYGKLSADELNLIEDLLNILKNEKTYLEDINDMYKQKIQLQKHRVTEYSKFETTPYPSSIELIPMIVTAMFPDELITPKEKSEILKINNANGQTTLHMAVAQDNPEIITSLLASLGIDQIEELLSVQNNLGTPPLHMLMDERVGDRQEIAMRVLSGIIGLSPLDKNLDRVLSIRDKNGQTLLHIMARNEYSVDYINQITSKLLPDQRFKLFFDTDKSQRTALSLYLAKEGSSIDQILLDIKKSPQVYKNFLETKDANGRTVFHNLAYAGNIQLVVELLSDKNLPENFDKTKAMMEQDNDGNPPLHCFMNYLSGLGHKDLPADQLVITNLFIQLRILLDKFNKENRDKILNKTNKQGQTILHVIAQNAHIDFVTPVLTVLSNFQALSLDFIKMQDVNGNTFLQGAVLNNLDYSELSTFIDQILRKIKELIEIKEKNKKNVNKFFMELLGLKNNKDMNLFHCLAQCKCNVTWCSKFIEELEYEPASVLSLLGAKDKKEQTPLHAAVANYPEPYFVYKPLSLKKAQALLNKAYVNYKLAIERYSAVLGDKSVNKLKIAKLKSEFLKARELRESAQYALDRAEQLDAHTKMTQICKENIEALISLFKSKEAGSAVLNKYLALQDIDENTALHLAAGRGANNLITTLVVDQNIILSKNSVGDTPLHLAMRNGRADFVKILLEFKVKNRTPLMLLSDQNNQGETPLHIMASTDQIEIAKIIFGEEGKKGIVPCETSQHATRLVKCLTDIKTKGQLLGKNVFGMTIRRRSVMDVAGPRVRELLSSKLAEYKKKVALGLR